MEMEMVKRWRWRWPFMVNRRGPCIDGDGDGQEMEMEMALHGQQKRALYMMEMEMVKRWRWRWPFMVNRRGCTSSCTALHTTFSLYPGPPRKPSQRLVLALFTGVSWSPPVQRSEKHSTVKRRRCISSCATSAKSQPTSSSCPCLAPCLAMVRTRTSGLLLDGQP